MRGADRRTSGSRPNRWWVEARKGKTLRLDLSGNGLYHGFLRKTAGNEENWGGNKMSTIVMEAGMQSRSRRQRHEIAKKSARKMGRE